MGLVDSQDGSGCNIIEGAISFVPAIVASLLTPELPESTTGSQKWLFSAEQLAVARDRIARDRVAQESDRSLWFGFKLALTDYRTWTFGLVLIANHAAYGFNYFYPSIVKGFNLGNNIVTLVLTSPPYLVGAAASFFISWSSYRRNERSLHIAIPMCLSITGFIISVATVNSPARYAASFRYVVGSFAANGLVYSWAASVLNQTPEKKAVATSLINVLPQLGNIMSPYFFRSQDEPRHHLALILLIVFAALCGSICLFL